MPFLKYVKCPHCEHAYTADDMHNAANDLWAIAPNESTVEEICVACGEKFVVAGSYRPSWKTARDEEAIDSE